MLSLLVGAAAGAGAGVALWRWLRRGAYRVAEDTPRGDLHRTWLVVAAATAAGAVGGSCPGWLALPAWVYLVGGVAVSWTDLDVHRVPDRILVRWTPAVAAAVILAAAGSGDWSLPLLALAGGLAMGAVYLVLVLVGSMGLGDLKLAAVTGLLTGVLGLTGWLTGLVAGLAAGAAAGLWLLARGRSRSSHLALAPAIVVGAAVAVLRVAIGL